ncbi:MAG TPA: NDP-hexose 2,3-dehydratase family protein [Streptosporangiaceae bacterium]|nr:NDP-hexose 2,3-dehydratase family protein [Streptosporangiaceae bacterium]
MVPATAGLPAAAPWRSSDLDGFAESALTTEGAAVATPAFHEWLADRRRQTRLTVTQIPFAALRGWGFERDTGNLVHDSGRFFSVEGLRVQTGRGGEVHARWFQPIINQPEIGILGIAVKRIHGVLHCLMQAKVEPGNANGVQLSPTVQATLSNYTGVHQGKPVRYLDYFTDRSRGRTLVDVLQSEQGAWFYRKRNRNMVVAVDDDVEAHEDFCWLTFGQLRRLLALDDVVNMDVRTVFACLSFEACAPLADQPAATGDDAARFRRALLASLSPGAPALLTATELLSWFTEVKTRSVVSAERIPLAEVANWLRLPSEIRHESGRYFSLVAVEAEAGSREVARWTQPLLRPHGPGVVAFLARRFGGVLHVLAHARVEPGFLDVVELAPTVQCTPGNYRHLPAAQHPPFLARVLSAPASQIRYDAVQSEEGGRFDRAQNRYMVVEIDDEPALPEDFRWLTIGQLTGLLRHSNYLNVQARSLIAALHSVW